MTDGPDGQPEPFAFAAALSVCVDVANPLAYLALAPVAALARELAIAVDWLPFPAPGLKPPPPPAADRGTRHRRMRAAYQESEIARYAEAQGVSIREPFRAVDSAAACLGHLWLRERLPEQVLAYLERLFRGHWDGTLDVARPATVARLIESVGGRPDDYLTFAAGVGPAELKGLRERLVAAGVFTVPSLVVDDEVFVGRAHLPMVRWQLQGRNGPPPV